MSKLGINSDFLNHDAGIKEINAEHVLSCLCRPGLHSAERVTPKDILSPFCRNDAVRIFIERRIGAEINAVNACIWFKFRYFETVFSLFQAYGSDLAPEH